MREEAGCSGNFAGLLEGKFALASGADLPSPPGLSLSVCKIDSLKFFLQISTENLHCLRGS